MTTIIEMAEEAGLKIIDNMIWVEGWEIGPYMQRFAELVRADEREAILELVNSYAKNNTDLADAIRARGNT